MGRYLNVRVGIINVPGAIPKWRLNGENENLAIGLPCKTNFEKFWITVGFRLNLFEFVSYVSEWSV